MTVKKREGKKKLLPFAVARSDAAIVLIKFT